jgi:hypothetical protein
MVNSGCPACYCISEEKHFPRAWARVFKMAPSNDVHCKKWALIEFLVTENKSVANMYNWFRNVCDAGAVDKKKTLIAVGISEF